LLFLSASANFGSVVLFGLRGGIMTRAAVQTEMDIFVLFVRSLSGARFSTDTGDAKASAARWMREAGDQTGKLLEKPLCAENRCIFGASC
jgi:hypothetical protein